jgi:hypothetical protein
MTGPPGVPIANATPNGEKAAHASGADGRVPANNEF